MHMTYICKTHNTSRWIKHQGSGPTRSGCLGQGGELGGGLQSFGRRGTLAQRALPGREERPGTAEKHVQVYKWSEQLACPKSINMIISKNTIKMHIQLWSLIFSWSFCWIPSVSVKKTSQVAPSWAARSAPFGGRCIWWVAWTVRSVAWASWPSTPRRQRRTWNMDGCCHHFFAWKIRTWNQNNWSNRSWSCWKLSESDMVVAIKIV